LIGAPSPRRELGGTDVEVLGGDHARVEQEALERRQPALVVARGVAVLVGRGDLGDQAVAEIVPVVDLRVAERDRHPEDAPFPRRFEDQFAVFARHGQVVAQVLDPRVAHRRPSVRYLSVTPGVAGASTFATPIIASRLTRAASSSSVRPSVPAGRSGRTM
jgi:hypothetical protein